MSKAARQQSARERMREEQRRKSERQRMMRRVLVASSVVVVIAIAVGIGIFVQSQRAQGGGDFEGQLPAASVSDGSVVVAGQGVDGPVVDVYEDFRCPHCKELEDRSGDVFKRLASNGEAKIVYHPVAVIDRGSVRSGAASLCAAESDAFMPYHDLLFENQQSASFDRSTLTGYADEVGINGSDFGSCMQQNQNRILQNTQQAQQRPGFEGTPTVFVNGAKIPSSTTYNPEALREAIVSAGDQQ